MPTRRRGRSALVAAGTSLLLLACAGCGDDPARMPTVDGVPPTASAPEAGLQVRPVLEVGVDLDCDDTAEPAPPGNPPAGDEATLCDLDGTGYRVGPAVAGQEGVEAADLEPLSQGWRIQVSLDPAATEAVAGLAEQAASSDTQVAFVVDGLVLNAPTVAGTIGGTLQLVGSWSEGQAEDYAARIAP